MVKKIIPSCLILAMLLAGFFFHPVSAAGWRVADNDLSSHYEELDKWAKKSLHDYFIACKAFWVEKGGGIICSLDTVSGKEYGFSSPEGISIKGEGTDDTFEALAYHKRSIRVFRINSEGSIVEVLSL